MEILITPRLTLRAPIALDAEDIAHWLSDWDVTKNLGRVPWPYSFDEAEKWVVSTAHPEKQVYTIHRQSLIGVAGLIGNGDTRTLAYWLAKPWHGQGFMREALTCIFDTAFADPSFHKIQSSAIVDNFASLKLQGSLGFKTVGTNEIFSVPRQQMVTVEETVLTRETWLARSKIVFPAKNTSQQQHSSQFAA